MSWRLAVALVLALVLSPLPGSSQQLRPLVVEWETKFRIDSSLGEDRGQRVVQGYIDNTSGDAIKRIRLLVDALEGERIVGQTVSWLGTDLTPGTRAYFKVPAPAQASAYRISVFDYDLRRFATTRLDLPRAVDAAVSD
jgi:hypothetical protein